MPPNLSPEEKEAWKEAVKAGIKEWLDEQFQQFGKWSAGFIAAAALGALVIFMLKIQGHWK